MHLCATFRHSLYLEIVINRLLQDGISKEQILALPLEPVKSKDYNNDWLTVHKDGFSKVDGVFISATVFMLLGCIYGFIWKLGPIIWGLIGLLVGGVIGLLAELIWSKIPLNKFNSPQSEVVLIIDCDPSAIQTIEKMLVAHQALGIAKFQSVTQHNPIAGGR